jgi:hypothetical protein
MTLPEMSVIDTHLPSNTKIRGYTVEQMLAWGKACAAAEREQITKMLNYLDMKAQPYHNYYKHAAVEINREEGEGELI